MPPDDIDNCTQVLGLRIRPSERKVLDERAGDKSITAYVRQQLGLDEALHGEQAYVGAL